MLQHFLLLGLLVVLLLWHELRLRQTIQQQQQYIQRLQANETSLKKRVVRRGKRLDTLLDTINEVVLRLDRSGQVKSMNKLGRNLFQLPPNTPLPQPLTALHRDPDWIASLHECLRLLPKSSDLPELHIHQRALKPKLTQLGDNQVLLICMDVTEQHQLQEQRSIFLSNLMHDLKTPLTSLLGYARSMQTFASDKKLRQEATTVIVNEARHVNSLLEALLCVDQIEHGKRLRGSCDLVQLLPQVWAKLDTMMQDKGLTLELNISTEQAIVPMHEIDCVRVMSNIASNAVHYSDPSGAIHCHLHREDGQVMLEVCDQGPGISDADLPHITERFYRADATRSRGGHGLGLAIVHETMQRDGGRVDFSHNTPHGLCVNLHFPH
jgi:two-component system phosphate regulon sensor histidine kinase PhoR